MTKITFAFLILEKTNNKMIYGYIRVSTEKQNLDNQRFELENFAKQRNWQIFEWIEETISGTKKIEERKLGNLLGKMIKGDVLIVTELSRLGRNLMQIMSILNMCMENDICVHTTKEGYELGNNINSKVLAFAFGLSAEIERNLISQRTKEALARRRAEGVILGRPIGSKSAILKLTGNENVIKELLKDNISKSEIGRKFNVHRTTVTNFMKNYS
jgi:DNA invertase Pin-like site-specific DNA recombinase